MLSITMAVTRDQIKAITQPLRFSACAADHIAPWTVKPTNKAASKTSQERAGKTCITVLQTDAVDRGFSHQKTGADGVATPKWVQRAHDSEVTSTPTRSYAPPKASPTRDQRTGCISLNTEAIIKKTLSWRWHGLCPYQQHP